MMKRTALTFIAIIALSVSAVFVQDKNAEAANAAISFRGAGFPQAPQIKPTPRPELKILWLSGVTLNKTTTIAGSVNGDIIGTVRLLRPALQGGVTVDISLDGPFHVEAGIPVSLDSNRVTIPSGQESANFRIRTLTLSSYNYPLQYTVRAKYTDETRTANFTLEALTISSLIVVPPTGLGPYTATGTVRLNARPAASRIVTLTSSNPNVVRFGTIGSAQNSASLNFTSNDASKGFSIVASSVPQPTTVTITATMNGRTVSRQITVGTL